jgi:monofunctional biosynthetic peptidoglycan transglycosylase
MPQRKKQTFLRKTWKWTKRIVLFMFVSSFIYVLICKWIMPPITATQVGNYIGGYGLKRDYVELKDISPEVKLAAIASEDQLYADHNGFDWKAMQKSLDENPNKKRKKRARGGGASTISQQTAKNIFLWQGGGVGKYIRKIPEFYFTGMIELIWGKKRILEVYLNTIEMGPGIFGIEAASKKYFSKSAKDLTRLEAATIIACLPNPKKFTVVPMSRWVAWKRQLIVRQMNNLAGDEKIEAIIK